MRAGAEIQTISLINSLDNRCFKKYLFVFEDGLEILDQLDRSNVTLVHVARRFKADMRPVLALASLLRREHIEIVHCSLQMALFVGWWAIRLTRHRPDMILAVHTTINRNRKNDWLDRCVFQWMMRDAATIICVCNVQRETWLARFPALQSRIRVVYNGIDTTWFSREALLDEPLAIRRSLDIDPDAFVMISVAAFRPEKGHDLLLEALRMLLGKVPHAQLLLLGDGVQRRAIEDKVRQLGLEEHVHLLGSRPDVRPFLAVADVSVMVSTAVETFSMAMLESMSMEVPIVASDIGGTREAVRSGETGVLVEVGNVAAISDALVELADNQELRQTMGRNGRRVVEEEFGSTRMVMETAAIIGDTTLQGIVNH